MVGQRKKEVIDLSRILVSAGEKDGRLFVRDIHDTLSSYLAVLKYELEST
jgi:hypothetical protein